MRIKELKIDVFGGVRNKQITLSDGLNLLVGENESGKSTVMLFIKFMLYGMPKKGHEDRDRSVNRTEHCARGSMTLSHEGEEYRIERSYTENGRGGSDRYTLYRLSDGAEVFRGQAPWEVFLKVPREVFESSALIGQMRCDLSEGKRGAEAIRNLLSSADESADLSKAVEKLEKIRVGYRTKTGKAGRLFELSGAIHKEKQLLERAVADRARIAELEKRSDKLREDYENAERRLQAANEVMQRLGKIELIRRFDALQQRELALGRLERDLDELREEYLLTDWMPKGSDVERLSVLADRLEEAEASLAEADEALRILEDEADYDEDQAEIGSELESDGGVDGVLWEADRLKAGKKRLHGFGALLLIGGLAGILLGAILWSDLIAIGISAAVGLLGGFLWWRGSVSGRRLRDLAQEYGVHPSGLEGYLRDCVDAYHLRLTAGKVRSQREAEWRAASSSVKKAAERMEDELKKTLPEEDVELTAEAGRKEAKRLRAFLDAYGERMTKKSVLEQGIAEERRLLSAYDEQEIREEIGDLEVSSVDPSRAAQEQRFYQSQWELLRQKKERAEVERISLRATAADPMPLSDHLEALQSEYARAEEYADAVELAISALRDAGETMSGTVTPILGKRAGEIMEFLSDGRYPRLFAGSDLVPALEENEGVRVPSDLLSGGTRDAAYLSLRISLLLLIYGGELPPLLMDESLCQLDGVRMGRALTLLGRFCENHFQCLLFTCHDREAEFCRRKGIPVQEIAL